MIRVYNDNLTNQLNYNNIIYLQIIIVINIFVLDRQYILLYLSLKFTLFTFINSK